MARKLKTDIHITGLRMTQEKQQQVGTALWLRIIQLLDGEVDGATITFEDTP